MSLLYKTNFFSSSSSASKTTAAATDDNEYISAEDEDYAAKGEEEEEASVSLGSEDTDIDPDEVQDLEEDAKMPRTPGSTKKSADSASAKKKSAQADPVDDLVADIGKLSMNSMAPDFNYH
eukprot:scaffold131243_cov40-Cyclotella_meneghiniana.AAC.1